MDIITHEKIDTELCGTPVLVEKNHTVVELTATENMMADTSGLIHGGFIFGLADYAAMLAVNHPNVVLGGADVKFTKPVVLNDTVKAEAVVEKEDGKKRIVRVTVRRDSETVFDGTFTCFVLPEHILGQDTVE